MQRTNKLVEQAFGQDPRIKQFKEEEKLAKSAKRRGREAAEQAAADEAAQKAEVERIAREKVEAEEKQKAEAAKKDKDAAKNAVKKEKKTIRRIFRDADNFLSANASADAVVLQTDRLETLLNTSDASLLEELRVKFEKVLDLGSVSLSLVLDAELLGEKQAAGTWSKKAKDALVEAFKKFSIGTAGRWESIAAHVKSAGGEDHSIGACIEQAKLSHVSIGGKAISKPAAEAPKATGKAAPTTEKPKTPGSAPATAGVPSMALPENDDWKISEQVAFEAALKKHTAAAFSKNPNDRWNKIAEEVPNRDAKACKNRLKTLKNVSKK